MNKFYIHHIVKANIYVSKKLKVSTSNSYSHIINFISNISSSYLYTINFISKKVKFDI